MMHIVGGVYREQAVWPAWDQVYGSGGRAAAAVSRLAGEVTLHSRISEKYEEAVQALSDTYSFDLNLIPQSSTIRFCYLHGLSIPEVFDKVTAAELVRVEGEHMLVFGMLEGDSYIARGHRVVYDPQSDCPTPFSKNGSKADHLAYVLNLQEGKQLTHESDPDLIASKLRQDESVSAVVLKCGSRGALAYSSAGVERVPAYKTSRVWPIGSGDVFSAVFALHWAELRKPVGKAARAASLATAYYCATKALPIPEDNQLLHSVHKGAIQFREGTSRRRTYLAAPFFDLGQVWLIHEARRCLSEQDLDVFSPFHDVGVGVPGAAAADLEAIQDCDSVFVIASGRDPGAIFECGYAYARGKPVVVLAENATASDTFMMEGTNCTVTGDFATAIYAASWA